MYAFSGTALYVAGLAARRIRRHARRHDRRRRRSRHTGHSDAVRRPPLRYAASARARLFHSRVHVGAAVRDATGTGSSYDSNRSNKRARTRRLSEDFVFSLPQPLRKI